MFNFIDVNSITASKEIDKLEAKVFKAYTKTELQENAHELLVALVEFCNKHKDGSRLDKFMQNAPNTFNRTRAREWLAHFSGWNMREDKAGVVKFLARKEDGEKLFFLDPEGRDVPFYVYEDPNNKEKKEWVFENNWKRFMDSAYNHQKKGDLNNVDKVHLHLISQATMGLRKKAEEYVAEMAAKGREADMKDVTPQSIEIAAVPVAA